jgi:hypothetical protein
MSDLPNIGFPELLLILSVALLIFGPRQLAGVGDPWDRRSGTSKLMTLGLALASMTRLTGLEGLFWLPFLGISFALGLGFAWVTIPAQDPLAKASPGADAGTGHLHPVSSGKCRQHSAPAPGRGLADLIGIRKMMFILACITLGAAATSVHRTRS